MAKVTLNMILDEIKKRDSRFDQIDSRFEKVEARADARFEMLKSEFQRLESKVDTGFAEVKQDLRVIRDQTAHLTERVTRIESTR